MGLPPPTRGILPSVHAPAALRGSTPAHAGNTLPHSLPRPILTVYPRPRGEYVIYNTAPPPISGLPPPTRGIPLHVKRGFCQPGSTPAHAGNTSPRAPPPTLAKVYPRPRGEYAPVAALGVANTGLPPPTRGIPRSVKG